MDDNTQNLARIRHRVYAVIADDIVNNLFSTALTLALAVILGITDFLLAIIFIPIVWICIYIALDFFNNVILLVLLKGQSLGKMIVSIKVVRSDGLAVTLGDALVRWLTANTVILFLSSLGFILIYVVIRTSALKQSIHDMAANTIVIQSTTNRNTKFMILTFYIVVSLLSILTIALTIGVLGDNIRPVTS